MSNKKFDFKSMFVGIIVGAGLFGGIVGASTLVSGDVYLNSFPIVANGKSYTTTLPLLNYTGSTYVPLKELATLTGANVSFKDSTIYIDSKASQTVVQTPTSSFSQLEMDIKDTNSAYINLSKYNATTATISVSDSCVKLSQSVFTKSGMLIMTGSLSGKSTVTIKYNTGDVEYIYVTVNDDDEEEETEVEVGSYKNVYIDLKEHDSKKASLSMTSGSSCVTLNKTSFTSSGNLKITGKKEGEASIKIKYDSGDIGYIYVKVLKSEDDEDEIELEAGSYKNVYIDLDDYDADEAKVSIISGSTYITLNKTTFTSSGNLKITAKKEGSAKIRVKYDSDETQYIYVEVTEDEDEIELKTGSYKNVYIDLDDYDADEATLSISKGSTYITLSKTTITSSGNVKITAKKEGSATVKVKYDSGKTQYIYIDVIDDEDDYDYDDYDYEDELTIDVDDYDYIYVDLDAYDADEAYLTILSGKSYITLGKTTVTKTGDVKVTGKKEGEAIIEVEYDTGDYEYFWIEVEE